MKQGCWKVRMALVLSLLVVGTSIVLGGEGEQTEWEVTTEQALLRGLDLNEATTKTLIRPDFTVKLVRAGDACLAFMQKPGAAPPEIELASGVIPSENECQICQTNPHADYDESTNRCFSNAAAGPCTVCVPCSDPTPAPDPICPVFPCPL